VVAPACAQAASVVIMREEIRCAAENRRRQNEIAGRWQRTPIGGERSDPSVAHKRC